MPQEDDDDELLVLADQLQLEGDPRGELIGVQVELERGGFSRARGVALRRRERDLLAENGDAWANLEGLGTNPVFRRGFVDEILIDVRTFVSRQREVWAAAPRLRRLRFHGLEHHVRMMGTEPDPTDAREVCYWIERILASKRVTSFEAVDPIVRWSRILPYVDHDAFVTEAVVEWLVDSNALEGLVGLQLPCVNVATFQRLRRYGGLQDLRLDLDMRYTDACDDPGELRPRRLALTSVDGRHPEAALALLRTPIADEVVDLELSELAVRGRSFAKLKTLRGGLARFAADLPLLADDPALSALEELVLSGAKPDLTPLHAPRHLESLRVLRLASDVKDDLKADDVLRFLDSPLGQRLEALDLRPAPPELAEALRDGGWDGCLYV